MIPRLSLSLAQWTKRSSVQTAVRTYALSRESAEQISSQLSHNRARLYTPEDLEQGGAGNVAYKGLVILAAGPVIGEKCLKKLPTPYLQSGFAVMTVVHRQSDFAFCTVADRTVDKIFNILSSTLDDGCPIILKLYCTASYSFLPRIVQRISGPDCNLNIIGAIFDSGPPLVHYGILLAMSRYFHNMGKYPTPLHRVREVIVPFLSSAINAWNKRRYLEELMYSPNSKLLNIPQLYIYSLIDAITDYQYMKDMIDKQKEHGANVIFHTFPDTPHMLHRLKYPKEYDNIIFHFLKTKCNLSL